MENKWSLRGMEFESPVFRMIEISVGITPKDVFVLNDIDDIEYFKRKMASALKVPPEFLCGVSSD